MSRRRRDEHGAVALLVAVVAILVMILAGFVVDFGAAFVSKRQLSTAADAGAMAAARVYADNFTGTCNSSFISSNRAAAQKEADKLGQENWPNGASTNPIQVICTDDGLEVTYRPENTVSTTFGKFAGVDSIDTEGIAAARINGAVGGLRPWGICSGVVTTSQNVIFVPLKGGSTADSGDPCGSVGPPGGWWVAQCTGQGNGTGATEDAVEKGCSTSNYQAVPGQPTDPKLRSDHLQDYCPKKAENSTCLASDTGANFHLTWNEWAGLVGQTFEMPVFCFPPQCTPAGYSGNGGTASYAISTIATIEICGSKLEGHPGSSWASSKACTEKNPKSYTSNSVTSGSGLFVVIKSLEGQFNWQGDAPLGSVALTR